MDANDACENDLSARFPPKSKFSKHEPVKKAEARTMRRVRATMPWVGPPCRLPVRRKIQINGGRTAKMRNRVQPIQQRRAQRAASPELLFTRATQSASKIQPVTSLPMPAARTVTPTGVPRSLSSVRIRHSTGKAVIFVTTISDMKLKDGCNYIPRVQFR